MATGPFTNSIEGRKTFSFRSPMDARKLALPLDNSEYNYHALSTVVANTAGEYEAGPWGLINLPRESPHKGATLTSAK